MCGDVLLRERREGEWEEMVVGRVVGGVWVGGEGWRREERRGDTEERM